VAAVRWTISAREDLRAIVEYIGRDSPTYAAATAARVVSAVGKLRRHPALGRVVPELENPTIRELIVRSYRVIYQIRGQQVGVLAVVHGSRELLRQIIKKPWSFE